MPQRFMGKTSTHGMDLLRAGNLSKAGWSRLRGREPHGCGDRGYMDVLAPPPATGPAPPTNRSPAFASAVAVAVASAGAGRSPAATSPPLRVRPVVHVLDHGAIGMHRIERRTGRYHLQRKDDLGAGGHQLVVI